MVKRKRNRKELSALLDGDSGAPVVNAKSQVSKAKPAVKANAVKSNESKKPPSKSIVKESVQAESTDDFMAFLKAEGVDKDFLEFADGEHELSGSDSEQEEEAEKADENDNLSDKGEELFDKIENDVDFSDEEEEMNQEQAADSKADTESDAGHFAEMSSDEEELDEMDFDDGLKLQDDSDNDEAEIEDPESDKKLVTSEKLKTWIEQLESGYHRPVERIANTLYASIVQLDSRDGGEKNKHDKKFLSNVKTTGNLFPELCTVAIAKVPPCLFKLFELEEDSKPGQLMQHKLWKKLRRPIKLLLRAYLALLDRLLDTTAQKNLLTTIRNTSILFIASTMTKPLLKAVVGVWAKSEEQTQRVQAFLTIHKVLRHRPDTVEGTMRMMYKAYLANAKFVNTSTLPNIYFMQNCLIELYKLNDLICYQHGFLYIRQLAIHLRKALMNASKDTRRTICNWQFLSAVSLWSKILVTTPALDELYLPLIQIIFGVFDIISGSPRLSPLTFHMIRCALLLCGPEHKYIPLWPYILELFKFLQTGSKAPSQQLLMEGDMNQGNILPDFQIALKLSSGQVSNKRLPDTILDELYDVAFTYSAAISHRIDYPEIVRMAMKRMREFSKDTKNKNHRNSIKKLHGLMETNIKYIETEREKSKLRPHQLEEIQEWQKKIYDGGTPLLAELASYKRAKDQERKEKLQGHIPKAEAGLKEYLESEEGQAEREKNRIEFENMADNIDSDASGAEDKDEAEEPEVDISRMSKSEKKKLTKGKKDKVEEFSLDTF